jgi:hypothetical protein
MVKKEAIKSSCPIEDLINTLKDYDKNMLLKNFKQQLIDINNEITSSFESACIMKPITV